MENPTGIKKLIGVVLCLALAGVLAYVFWIQKGRLGPAKKLPPYFSYQTEELVPLQSEKSQKEIRPEEVWEWEEKAFDIVGKTKSDTTTASRFYASLFTAQRDAAYLSHDVHGKFAGSLDNVSAEVICLFFSDLCPEVRAEIDGDPYSEWLAKIVAAKVRERLEEDKQNAKPYELKSGMEFWSGKAPFKGIDVGSWKTWLIQSGNQFRLPPPPAPDSPEDQRQLGEVRKIFLTLTDKQKNAIAYWAAGPGTKTAAGIWLKLAGDYMKEINIDLERLLLLRSLLAMGIADTEISAMDSKYTYWVKRPFMRDSTLLTFMPTPNHPSYPSDSFAVAAFSAAFLDHYFPEQAERWRSLAEEAGRSRIDSGIHFPRDIEQGKILGENIAQEIIRQKD